jgi:hypothetical protein
LAFAICCCCWCRVEVVAMVDAGVTCTIELYVVWIDPGICGMNRSRYMLYESIQVYVVWIHPRMHAYRDGSVEWMRCEEMDRWNGCDAMRWMAELDPCRMHFNGRERERESNAWMIHHPSCAYTCMHAFRGRLQGFWYKRDRERKSSENMHACMHSFPACACMSAFILGAYMHIGSSEADKKRRRSSAAWNWRMELARLWKEEAQGWFLCSMEWNGSSSSASSDYVLSCSIRSIVKRKKLSLYTLSGWSLLQFMRFVLDTKRESEWVCVCVWKRKNERKSFL